MQALDWWLTHEDARGFCEELQPIPAENRQLRLLTRRRCNLVEEKTVLENQLRSHLQAACPSLVKASKSLDNRWFLNFLTTRPQLPQLAALRSQTLLQIQGVGPHRAQAIEKWQSHAIFSQDVELFSQWIQEDVGRLKQLAHNIDGLNRQIRQLGEQSQIFQRWNQFPGLGKSAVANWPEKLAPWIDSTASLAWPCTWGAAPWIGVRVNEKAPDVLNSSIAGPKMPAARLSAAIASSSHSRRNTTLEKSRKKEVDTLERSVLSLDIWSVLSSVLSKRTVTTLFNNTVDFFLDYSTRIIAAL